MTDFDTTVERAARAAYRAYGTVTGFKNFQGSPMPAWDDLGDTIQSAWRAAAEEVLVHHTVGMNDAD